MRAGAIYRVGIAVPGTYPPPPLLELRDCRAPIVIEGNNAVMRGPAGALFGTFDNAGKKLHPAMPYYGAPAIRVPYRYMILIERCASVTIRNLELDGMIGSARIGGQYGDTGWQIAMMGLKLVDNRGPELISSVYSHHHGLDGVMIDGPNVSSTSRVLQNVRCEYNGRQGCSVVGGTGYQFIGCTFAKTGRSAVVSAPSAGVDIEAEGTKRVSGLRFSNCRFIDNAGVGLLADQGPSHDVVVTDSLLVGTTSWAAWPRKPGFRFQRCKFVGAIVNAYGSDNPREAAQFVDCTFTDDPALAPGGRVYGRDGSVPMVDLGGSLGGGRNVAFVRTKFTFTQGKLPWTVGSIFEDVTMIQSTRAVSFPRGIYRGHNILRGSIDTNPSSIEGTVDFNGKIVGPSRF